MVFFELFAVTKAGVPKQQLAGIIRALCQTVMDQGGVVTNITSYGERRLAYDIRRPGERHSEVRAARALPAPATAAGRAAGALGHGSRAPGPPGRRPTCMHARHHHRCRRRRLPRAPLSPA